VLPSLETLETAEALEALEVVGRRTFPELAGDLSNRWCAQCLSKNLSQNVSRRFVLRRDHFGT